MEIAAGAKVQMVGSTRFFTYKYNKKLEILFSVSKYEGKKKLKVGKHSIQNVNKV
jgi:hypothetical protein